MRRLLAAGLVLGACGGGGIAAEAGIAAATFLVDVPADELEIGGRDRPAGTGDEDRLDVLLPGLSAEIVAIYPSTPRPEPFEFVRDPLSAGGVERLLDGADRVVAVVYPLVDRTPGGRVLTGSLIVVSAEGAVIATDWDDASDQAIRNLVEWGRGVDLTALQTIELAVRGLAGSDSSDAQTAADFLR
ncbi:MAG TPA: hypothetical protein VMS74_11295 [Acidimicrobiia bacterium]|nr:hypothetical protein [Acidimicrobiia bacterium]